MMNKILLLFVSLLLAFGECKAVQNQSINALVLMEEGGQHKSFTDEAQKWLTAFSKQNKFKYTVIHDTKPINEAFLASYNLIIQLNYPPYNWTAEAQRAFISYMETGKGGWIGFHHATLLGEFDGYPMWQWFSDFMGGIRFKDYIAPLATGTVNVESPAHPVMHGVHKSFTMAKEEWYTFDRSPRKDTNIKVLASVNEATYTPKSNVTMGDHPVVWTNENIKARNVYFLMGHDGSLFQSTDFIKMFTNAIFWAAENAGKMQTTNTSNYAKYPRFKALIYYTDKAEEAHVQFAEQAIDFFKRLNYGDGYVLDITKDLSAYPYERLKEYNVVVMLNTIPWAKDERSAFEKYMETGGGWIGFHAAAYNDRNTKWKWFVDFLGGSTFYWNNWPPQPVKLTVDEAAHDVTKNLPRAFVAPESEWYQWSPSPRENSDVDVLLSLSPDNYPLGIKDVVVSGDFPVVWTNNKYRMIYLNMGHGNDEFSDATQKLLFVNAFRWIVSKSATGDPFMPQ